MAINPMVNDTIDFQLVVNGINGDARKGATIITGLMSYQAALFMDQELASKHANLFAYFKDKVGGVDDPSIYQYFAIRNVNDKMEVIGVPWINEDTYRTVKSRTRTYVIVNFEEKMDAPFAKFFKDMGANYTYVDDVK